LSITLIDIINFTILFLILYWFKAFANRTIVPYN